MSLRDRLLRVLPVTLVIGLALAIASLDNDDYCGTVGECLGTAFDDAAVIGLSLLLGPLLLWALKLPRVLAHTAALVVALGSLWYAASELRLAFVPGTGYDAPMPWPVALLVGVFAALAATYAAGPGGRWQARLAVLASTPLLATGAHLVGEQVQGTVEAPVTAGVAPDRVESVRGGSSYPTSAS